MSTEINMGHEEIE